MNGIKISKEDFLKLKQADKGGVLFDCLQGIGDTLKYHLKRIYIGIGVIAVILVLEFPNWAKFIIGKAIAALK